MYPRWSSMYPVGYQKSVCLVSCGNNQRTAPRTCAMSCGRSRRGAEDMVPAGPGPRPPDWRRHHHDRGSSTLLRQESSAEGPGQTDLRVRTQTPGRVSKPDVPRHDACGARRRGRELGRRCRATAGRKDLHPAARTATRIAGTSSRDARDLGKPETSSTHVSYGRSYS